VSLVRVYRYKVFNNEHGAFIDTEFPVYATLEKIASLKAQPILSTSLEIEESQVNPQGFHHPSNLKQ
jgi:hypothetical protein